MGNTVISGILFQPPSPPNALRFLADDLLNKKKEAAAITTHQSLLLQAVKHKNICVNHIWLYSPTSRDGNEWNLIPAIHITHTNDIAPSSSSSSSVPDSAAQKYTLLYSHGNAEDIGLITAFMIDMARLLQVNVLCYDYSGYGMSVDTEYVSQFFKDYGREIEFWKKYRNCTSGALGSMMAQQYGEIPARNGHMCRFSRDVFVAPMVHPRDEMTMSGGSDLQSYMKEAGKDEEENDAYGFTNTCSCNDDNTSGQFASNSSTPAATATATSLPSPVPSFARNNGNEISMNTEEHRQEQQLQYQQQLLLRHSWTMPVPSDTNCYANILSAYEYLTKVERTCPPQHVILYGKSVGSGPTCWLSQRLCGGGESDVDGEEDGMCDSVMCNAETRDPVESSRNDGPKVVGTAKTTPRLAGVVLHSPFLSVIRVVLDVGFTPIGDLFPNIDRVGDFKCPVYVIHGSHDAIVPFYHGQTLFESLPDASKVVPFWAHGAGHNNIEMDMPTAYIKRLQQFIRQCDRSIYPKGSGIRSSRSKSMNANSSNTSSSGGIAEEQTRQMKKLDMHLSTSQASNTQSMSAWMMQKGGAANNTQTSKQRKQKGTLVLRPFHTQTRAPPPPPPPPPINKQLLNQHTIVESGVGDNSTTLVLTSNGVHASQLQPHQSGVYHRSSSTPFSIDSPATTMLTTSLSPSQLPSNLSVQQQHRNVNHPVMYSKQQLVQPEPQQYEVYRSLNQQNQHQHTQYSSYRTLNSA